MQAIKVISECIEEELAGAEKYIRLALRYKPTDKALADTFYSLTQDEMKHSIMLHNIGVKAINDYKMTGAIVPESMQAVYDYLHEKHMDHANKIKMYQEQYSNE